MYSVRFSDPECGDSVLVCESVEDANAAIEAELQATFDELVVVDGIPERDIRRIETYCGYEMYVSSGDYCLTIVKEWLE